MEIDYVYVEIDWVIKMLLTNAWQVLTLSKQKIICKWKLWFISKHNYSYIFKNSKKCILCHSYWLSPSNQTSHTFFEKSIKVTRDTSKQEKFTPSIKNCFNFSQFRKITLHFVYLRPYCKPKAIGLWLANWWAQ